VANARKAKGTRFESDVRDRLRLWGLHAYRPAQEGRHDVGDLHGVEPFILQAKAWENVSAALREGLDGARVQARHAGRAYGAVVIKRTRASIGLARVALTLDDFARVLLRLRRAEDLLAVSSPEAYVRHRETTWADLRTTPSAAP
jgi:hypothetical protein